MGAASRTLHRGARRLRTAASGALLASAALLALGCATPDPEHIEFTRDIEPLLRRNCHECHNGGESSGGLDLGSRDAAFESGPSGLRLVPGNPEASEVFLRVAGLSKGERMPLGGRLETHEVELIRRWIEQGAAWPSGPREQRPHRAGWAYEPPQRPGPPPTDRTAWVRSPIDAFVLSRIQASGLKPSAPAGKEALLRRLSLDLTGLPPSIGEIDAFLADRSPASYERQVERLLGSPHYGEHWGRIWLDAARHADSNGYEKDKPRQVWAYRDWVVSALNADLGYDRFVIEQVAGDLLPNAGPAQRIATGFLRGSMTNEEGGADPEQFRVEALFDRMEVIGKAVLGLTVQCAQCHDHKYDPISQREYYGLLAMLNSTHDSMQAVYTREEQRVRDEVLGEIRRIERGLQRENPDWRDRMAAWEAQATATPVLWSVLEAAIPLGSGEKYLVLEDKSILAQGFAPTQSTVSPVARLAPGTVRAVRLELLTDPRLPLRGPGRSPVGSAALSEVTLEIAPAATPEAWSPVAIGDATADFESPARLQDPTLFPQSDGRRRTLGGVLKAIDGDELTAWHTDVGPGRRNVPRKAVFRLSEALAVRAPSLLRVNLVMKHGGSNTDADRTLNVGRFRLSVTDIADAAADPLPAEVRRIVSTIPRESRTAEEEAAVFRFWRSTEESWSDANARIQRLWSRHPEGSTQLVATALEESRATRLLERGDFLRPGETVAPAAPSSLHRLRAEGASPNRLDLARWLVDRKSPTTARAIVNRIWQGHFGTGLVESTEDLGRRSSAPTHPDLLDWLAVELMDSNWSLKHVHRLIALSSTYRQSAEASSQRLRLDPHNRLLARAGRFRLDGEAVRDVALAAGSLLVRDLGGAPVYPPAPEQLFRPPASYAEKHWPAEAGLPGNYRRSLYTFRYRSVPYPVFETFDAPSGKFSCVRRDRSNTPLQALVTLNEPVFVDAARHLALLALSEPAPADGERIAFVFRQVLSRRPERDERAELGALLSRLRSRFRSRSGTARARALAGFAAGPETGPARARELAAWTGLARTVLNLDEAITRE